MSAQDTGNLAPSTISAIINMVCPECGGSMVSFGCRGKCGKDWREVWDAAVAATKRLPKGAGFRRRRL